MNTHHHRIIPVAALALFAVALGGAVFLAAEDADASYGDVGEELSGTYYIDFSDVGTIIEGPSILEAYTNDLGLTLAIGEKEYDGRTGDLSYRCTVIGTPTGSGEAVFTVLVTYRALSDGEYTESTDQVRIDIYDPTSPVPVSKVILSAGEHTLPVGRSLSISARTVPDRATDGSVVWSVDDGNGCISIGADGKTCTVTGVSAGTAVVRCSAADGSGAEATYRVTISDSCFEYTLSFDANGGEGAPDAVTEYAVDRYHRFDIAIPLDEPVRDGYHFEGWSWDADADEPDKGPAPGRTVKVSYPGKTFYAVWSEVKSTAITASSPEDQVQAASPTIGGSAEASQTLGSDAGTVSGSSQATASSVPGGSEEGDSDGFVAIVAVAAALLAGIGVLVLVTGRRRR